MFWMNALRFMTLTIHPTGASGQAPWRRSSFPRSRAAAGSDHLEREMAVRFVRVDIARVRHAVCQRDYDGLVGGGTGFQPHGNLAVHFAVHRGEVDVAN